MGENRITFSVKTYRKYDRKKNEYFEMVLN